MWVKHFKMPCLPSELLYFQIDEDFFPAESEVSAVLRPIILMSCLTNIKFSLPDVYQMESLFIFALIMTEGNGHG